MRGIKNEEEFAKLWRESTALVVDFSAEWCGPCKMLEPVLKKLEKNNPGIVFVKADVDRHLALSDKHGIEAMPTVLFVCKGREMKRVVGFDGYEVLSEEAKRLLRHAQEN